MSKIIAFGEIMLRLSPKDNNIIEDSNEYDAYYGGTESNTLVTLSSLGNQTTYITKIPCDSLGKGVIRHLRKHGVGIEGVVTGGDRLGLYFMEQGFGGRSSQVLYHRKGSSVNTLTLEELDIENIFDNASWFHLTGITLGISNQAKELACKLCSIAKNKNITISFDFNYRSKLWTIEEAKDAYKEIMPYIDVCFGNIFDLNNFLDIKGENAIEEFLKMYNIKYLINTKREVINNNTHKISGLAYQYQNNQLNYYHTNSYTFEILDRIGAGDCYDAGIIHILNQDINNIEKALNFGIRCDILKHFVKGDVLSISEQEVLNYNPIHQDVKR